MQGDMLRRIFFGFSIEAPWPSSYPEGRLVTEEVRHVTLAFLGNVEFAKLEEALESIPLPNFPIGPVGTSDKLLFLPEKTPRVVAHHVYWLSGEGNLSTYHEQLLGWLEGIGYSVDRRPLLPHVTVARAPFDQDEWEKSFAPLPMRVSGVHLYESLGNLTYESIWERPFLQPFEEFEHTADIAFHVRGKTEQELYVHAALALGFHFPPFLTFFEEREIQDHNDVIYALNQMLSRCDLEMGCPFKAVSYHGKIESEENLLNWEMVVDV